MRYQRRLYPYGLIFLAGVTGLLAWVLFAPDRDGLTGGASPVLIASQSSAYTGLRTNGGIPMASITIRNLNDDVKTRLRVRAADNGRSMEEEARLILREAVGRKPSSRNLASIIRSYFGPANGVDLELPPRELAREPPSFD